MFEVVAVVTSPVVTFDYSPQPHTFELTEKRKKIFINNFLEVTQ